MKAKDAGDFRAFKIFLACLGLTDQHGCGEKVRIVGTFSSAVFSVRQESENVVLSEENIHLLCGLGR